MCINIRQVNDVDLKIDVKEENSQSIMHLRGEIDIYIDSQLKDDLNKLVSEATNEEIVDLKDVTYMDSTGLGTFVSALKHAETANTTMTLIRANDRLYRLFQVTGLNDVIDVHSEKEGDEID